ncbi:hypothetical protein ACLOJK_033822 [Asimina triloba]
MVSLNQPQYSVLVVLLILAELGFAAFIFFDHSWKEVIPVDKTGDFEMIYGFLEKNWKIAKWIALGVIVLEALTFLLALIVRAANRPADYDSDDEYIAPRSNVRQPLINRSGPPATGVPVAGTLDQRPSRNDAWSTRMREKYGLDTSEFTYNPADSNRYQQAATPPAEEKGRCSIMEYGVYARDYACIARVNCHLTCYGRSVSFPLTTRLACSSARLQTLFKTLVSQAQQAIVNRATIATRAYIPRVARKAFPSSSSSSRLSQRGSVDDGERSTCGWSRQQQQEEGRGLWQFSCPAPTPSIPPAFSAGPPPPTHAQPPYSHANFGGRHEIIKYPPKIERFQDHPEHRTVAWISYCKSAIHNHGFRNPKVVCISSNARKPKVRFITMCPNRDLQTDMKMNADQRNLLNCRGSLKGLGIDDEQLWESVLERRAKRFVRSDSSGQVNVADELGSATLKNWSPGLLYELCKFTANCQASNDLKNSSKATKKTLPEVSGSG